MPVPLILPDTNFLIDHPDFLEEEWQLRPVEITISETVIAEVRGLSQRDYPPLALSARTVQSNLDKLKARADGDGRVHLDDDVTLSFTPRYTKAKPPLKADNPDHQLIAYARSQFRATPPRFCAILSGDKELCDIAEALRIIAVRPGHKMHEELERKHHWWTISREPVDKPAQPLPTAPGPDAHFENFIQHLYGQVIVNRFRTVMAIAPQEARLALTARIIERVPNPEKRVVLVVVQSNEDALYWAEQIRRQGEYAPADVQIFGYDNLDRLEKARAMIYRHDQVSRRLPRHLDRLALAEQKLTAVVDGCDLLDPVSLAHLLFECDQFIGLSHYPLGYAHQPANRMLDAFLRGKAQLAYAFADAERDGWGHPFDLYLRPVSLTVEEQQEWDEVNAAYIRQRERVVKQYPELADAAEFWQGLLAVLSKKAAPEAARLLELREKRERIAQLAGNKVNLIKKLLRPEKPPPLRRLIFDYTRQWTPVLLRELGQQPDLLVTELPPRGDEQRRVWERFAGNAYNTLLLSNAPHPDLPSVFFSELVILTPLRPMADISRIVDWALTHTSSPEALRIDLLYVHDTPEEVAMFDLAEACFDLRYTRRNVQ